MMKWIFLFILLFNNFVIVDSYANICNPVQEKNALELGKAAFGGVSYPITCGYLDAPYGAAGLSVHAGIDFGAPDGATVYAPISGKVVYSKCDFGTVTIYDRTSNLYVMFLHMKTRGSMPF